MIKVLRVQNYKSLKNLEIPLKPLTVLVGPNAAGKSNILDCLAFLADLAQPGHFALDAALKKRSSFSDLVWGGKTNRTVSISISWGPVAAEVVEPQYSVEVAEPPGVSTTAVITGESGVTTDPEGKPFIFYREGTNVKYETTSQGLGSGQDSALAKVSKARALQQAMLGWHFYDFVPSAMRALQQVAKQTRLRADGSNVATVLHWIYSEEPEIFQRVEELLKAAIPEVDRLLSPLTEDGKTYVAWREKHIPGRIPAWNMSEGSVRLVAMLVALLVPEPPPLVGFETPEIHLHPYQMEYLAGILKVRSERSQVLVTTHSPYLLNYIPLESVLIVEKEKGETKVEPVKDSAHLREALKRLGLGEMWAAGHLGGVP